MTIEDAIEVGNHVVEIDDWGGVHIHYTEEHDPPVSYSPETMRRIEQARKEVINGDSATDGD